MQIPAIISHKALEMTAQHVSRGIGRSAVEARLIRRGANKRGIVTTTTERCPWGGYSRAHSSLRKALKRCVLPFRRDRKRGVVMWGADGLMQPPRKCTKRTSQTTTRRLRDLSCSSTDFPKNTDIQRFRRSSRAHALPLRRDLLRAALGVGCGCHR